MNEIVFEILKIIVWVAVFIVICYLLPLIRGRIGQDKLEEITKWVNTAVLMAQQVYDAKTGAERKAIVVDLLRNILNAKNISISDEQLDMLIEAAVKAMKIKEGTNNGNKEAGR